jgi:glycosyltransferase involved in cell wall biosynthesis
MSFAFVLLTDNVFGGAEQRFTRIFFFLNERYKGNIFYFVSGSLKQKIMELSPDADHNNIIALDNIKSKMSDPVLNLNPGNNNRASLLKNYIKRTLIYHLYFYLNSRKVQYRLYKELKKHHQQYHIRSFIGVFSGILPLYFFLNKKDNRPGIIFSNMDSWFSNISTNPLKEWYRKYVSFNYAHENCDLVDFLSPFVYKGVQKLGVKVPVEKVNITPSSFIDYSKCHISAKSKFRIAFSGRLEKDKNPVIFMNAALELAKEHSDVEFHIMGEGRLSGAIKELAINCGLSNILFHGFHPNPPEILAETSVFVSIQSTNNYPSQSILEAMACGNAIIATDVGDTRMFVNEETGSLIVLSPDSLIDCMKWYIAHPKAALEKGVKASRYVRENHTIEKSADYYMKLFQKAEIMVTQ